MRKALLIVLMWHGVATACPTAAPIEVTTDQQPATTSPCMQQVDFGRSRRTLELGYSVGAAGTTQTGLGQAASAFAALELAYGLQFGSDPAQPSYEVEVNGAVAAQRSGGDISATGLVTRAGLRLGPARIAPSVIDEGRGNLAFFPLTMEIAHAGELAARPRLAARPELARALFDRERVELATRVVRVEGAGAKAKTTPPGETKPEKPSSWAIDVIPLHAGLDVAMQDAIRTETTIGGAMMGVVEHTTATKLDLLGVEHRRIDLAMTGPKSIDTVWMLKIDGVDPLTGSQYYVGWGEMIMTDELRPLAPWADPESGNLTIGGVGWYSTRHWGGFGMQYKREPYVTMLGELGLEDRVSAEVSVPRVVHLVGRTFAARTLRVVDDEVKRDMTAGVELDASYVRGGWTTKLGLELGRTYYATLDNTQPHTVGFAAGVDLTVQHSASRTWLR
ncbi:MAG TPA: hypothetical protein VIV11_27225 [Kofleriaceae bacterium]